MNGKRGCCAFFCCCYYCIQFFDTHKTQTHTLFVTSLSLRYVSASSSAMSTSKSSLLGTIGIGQTRYYSGDEANSKKVHCFADPGSVGSRDGAISSTNGNTHLCPSLTTQCPRRGREPHTQTAVRWPPRRHQYTHRGTAVVVVGSVCVVVLVGIN